ncbi:MAG TPA: hypothetical protein VMW66_03585 [Elusimicrobiales bacterium]|nr:hypothetical protein [Elusimicrobiales bacterium]
MKIVSTEDIKDVLNRACGADSKKLADMMQLLKLNQPEILNYLNTVGASFLNEDEQRCFTFMGVNIWQMMAKSNVIFKQITKSDIGENTAKVTLILRDLKRSADFSGQLKKNIKEDAQPAILEYVLTSLNTVHKHEIRSENKTLIFFLLKVLVDSFKSSEEQLAS